VAFQNSAYTNELTETIQVTLYHPCKKTLLTSSQTISDATYIYNATKEIAFAAFSDSVSAAYSNSSLCGVTYVLSPTDLHNLTMSIDNTTLKISITGAPIASRGQTVAFTLSAVSVPLSDTPSS